MFIKIRFERDARRNTYLCSTLAFSTDDGFNMETMENRSERIYTATINVDRLPEPLRFLGDEAGHTRYDLSFQSAQENAPNRFCLVSLCRLGFPATILAMVGRPNKQIQLIDVEASSRRGYVRENNPLGLSESFIELAERLSEHI